MISRSSGLFWAAIIVLFGAAAFFTLSVRLEMRQVQGSRAMIESGTIVTLTKVIDGDSVLVTQEGQGSAPVRILGIKSFDAKIEKDVVTPYGQAAVQSLERILSDRPIRVLLNATAKDRHGRYIATLYVDDQDVGLRLIKEGLVLVYTVYPFPAMSLYLEQQDLARANRRGLWGNNDVADRALALAKAWQRQTQ
jgi:micrococcal nuclease